MARLTRTFALIDIVLWPIFHFLKMAAVRHLELLKFGNLTADQIRRPNVRHHTKFRKDRPNRSRDMADFRFSRWRPFAILDF